jgi:hypothetical protein
MHSPEFKTVTIASPEGSCSLIETVGEAVIGFGAALFTGFFVGCNVGAFVGFFIGDFVGFGVGASVGFFIGDFVGCHDALSGTSGTSNGSPDGVFIGEAVIGFGTDFFTGFFVGFDVEAVGVGVIITRMQLTDVVWIISTLNVAVHKLSKSPEQR